MIECLILGDSIAVGFQKYLERTKNHGMVCDSSSAKGGINTYQYNKMFGNRDLSGKTVIISLGSNDHQYVKTRPELETMRSKIKGEHVFWILPHGNHPESGVDISKVQKIVIDIAKQYGDIVMPITQSYDNVHATDGAYKQMIKTIKGERQ